MDPRLTHGVVVAALGTVVFLSWQLQYRQTAETLRKTREQLVTLSQRVEELEQLLHSAGGEAAWTNTQHEILQRITRRLPPASSVPQLLDALLGQVARANLALVNVNQGNLDPAMDAQDTPIVLDQTPCLRLPVTLAVEGRFHAILTLLQQFSGEAFPCVVRIEQIHLALKDPENTRLHATLQLVLYVLGS